jgi:DNA-binding ferritin-like protein
MSILLSKLVFTAPEQDYKFMAKQLLGEEVKAYGNAQYAELAVLLAAVRTLSFIHQQNHWCAKGKEYYGDHLLFMRLYETVDKEIDILAEKIVGLSSEGFVLLRSQCKHMHAFVELMGEELSDTSKGYKTSFQAELIFAALISEVFTILEQSGLLTPGLEQCLGTIMDTHEGNVYLLKQRYQA